jgi:hypothetical protein
MTRGRASVRRAGLLPVALGALLLAACSTPGSANPLATDEPTAGVSVESTSSTSPSPSGSASPATASPGTASPGTASPGSGTAAPGTASPSGGAVQVTCAAVTVTGLGRTSVGPLRTTDVATVVSDGRNLTPGTRQQTDFTLPVLTAPGGGTISDAGTVQQVANLLVGQKHRVLLERPPAPDESTDPTKRPFSSPGTYAVYNASSLVTTEAAVQCAGQQQTWVFTAEGDPATGQVNCAVEPARSASLARSVFAQSC